MSEPKTLVQFNTVVKLLEQFDKAWNDACFKSRTEALNYLMRSFVARRDRTREEVHAKIQA